MANKIYMDYLNSGDISQCYGCGACAEVCPQKCISMVEKKDTFLYPEIDKSKCVNCGLCSKGCPANVFSYNEPIKAIAAVHKKEEIAARSASGGAFASILELLRNDNTVVFGVVMERLKIKHMYSQIKDISVFSKSKYVQSDTNGSFSKVKQFLAKGKNVIFSGTPCQVMALRNFLKDKNTENLFTVDIVCHGVPSQKMFDMYIEGVEKKKGAVKEVIFKNKKEFNGRVNSRSAEIVYMNGDSTIESVATDPYLKAYYARINYRPSCMDCRFACRNRVSDITLGDAWGIERKYEKLDPIKGVSLVIANTEQGVKVLERLAERMDVYPISMEEAVNTNGQLKHPTEKHPKREEFIQLISEHSFDEAVRRVFRVSLMKRVLSKIKRVLRLG